MNRLTTFFFAVLFFCSLFAVKNSYSQSTGRVEVQLNCACSDAGGKAYLQALRTRLASNASFHEVRSGEAASENVIRVDIVSHSLPPKTNEDFGRTAIEIVCLHDGTSMRQIIETCNRLPMDVPADSIIAELGTL